MFIGCVRQRGLALILTLWLLAVLGLVITGVVATQRVESRQTHADLQRSKALVAAEGALSLAVFELLQAPERFKADGQKHPTTLDGVSLTVSVRSEHGKLDLNFGNLDYFTRFFRAMGASLVDADLWVNQIRALRSKGEPLQHLNDLLVATSMDVTMYERILPYVTLWGGDGVPVIAFADPVLCEAIGLHKIPQQPGNPGSVVSIDVEATLADGLGAGLMTTVLITPESTEGGLFKVLHWQER